MWLKYYILYYNMVQFDYNIPFKWHINASGRNFSELGATNGLPTPINFGVQNLPHVELS
jgi:hypothetical protein